MTLLPIVTRRILLRDMGKAGLAVMIFGAAACTTESVGGSTTSGGPTSTSTTSAGTSTSTGAPTTSTPATTGSWHRVDLEFVSAYVLARGGEAALVDTGIGGRADDIEAALVTAGLGWDGLAHVFVTHNHPDHQGSLAAVLDRAAGAVWYAGSPDLETISAPRQGTAVEDGQSIFDLEVIGTPGHTPGHIAILDRSGGVLVAGDALNGVDGGVEGANPRFSEDMDLANASVAKLAGFEYETLFFGHGEPVTSGASALVAELADSLGAG